MTEHNPLEEALYSLGKTMPDSPGKHQLRAEFLSAVRMAASNNHHEPKTRKQKGKLMRFVFAIAASLTLITLVMAGSQLIEQDQQVAQEPIGQQPQQTEPEVMYNNLAIEDLILLSDFPLLFPTLLPEDYQFEFSQYREGGKYISVVYACRGIGNTTLSFVQQTEPIEFLPFSDDDFVQEVMILGLDGRYLTGEWDDNAVDQYAENAYGLIQYGSDSVSTYQALVWSDEQTGIYYQLFTRNQPYYDDYSPCHLSREDLLTFAWHLREADTRDYPPSNILFEPQLFTRAESDILPSNIPETTVITGLTREEAEARAGYPLPQISNTYYRFKEAQFDEATKRVTLIYEYGGTTINTILLHIQPVPMRPPEEVLPPDLIGAHALVRQIPLEGAIGEYLHGSWLDENTPYFPPGWTPQWMDQMEEQRLRWRRGALVYELEMPLEVVTPEIKELLPTLANQIIEAQGDQIVGSGFMPTEEEMAAYNTENAPLPSFGNAVADAVFEAMLPTALPESFHFWGGSAQQSGTSVFLSYNCMWAHLWLDQSLSATPQRLTGVGTSTNVEMVQIGDVEGQYVEGSWEMPELDLEPGERVFYVQTWNNDLPVQQLMWNKNGIQYLMMLQEIGDVRNAANYTDECQLTRDEMVAAAESLVPSEQLGIQPTALLHPSDFFVRHLSNERSMTLPEPISREAFLEQVFVGSAQAEQNSIEEGVGYEFPLPGYIPENFELYIIQFNAQGWIHLGYYDPENYTHRLHIHLQPAENEITNPENIRPAGFDEIGANTALQQVLIGDLAGEYVLGDWRVDTRSSMLTPNEDGTYTAIWMPDVQWQRLRWEQDGVLIEIETGDKTTLILDAPLSNEELIRIAESFSVE